MPVVISSLIVSINHNAWFAAARVGHLINIASQKVNSTLSAGQGELQIYVPSQLL